MSSPQPTEATACHGVHLAHHGLAAERGAGVGIVVKISERALGRED